MRQVGELLVSHVLLAIPNISCCHLHDSVALLRQGQCHFNWLLGPLNSLALASLHTRVGIEQTFFKHPFYLKLVICYIQKPNISRFVLAK